MPGWSQDDQRKYRLLLLSGVILILLTTAVLNRSSAVRNQSDLFARWYAVRQRLLQGRSIYDPRNGVEAAGYKVIPTSPLEAGFYYPAPLVLILMPLALLPFRVAHYLWTCAVQLMILGTVMASARRLAWPDSIGKLTLFMVASYLFIPYWQQVIWSQFDAIGVLSLGMCILALQRRQFYWAGLWAVGLTFKPQSLLLTLFVLCFWSLYEKKRWGFLFGFVSGAIFLAGVAMIFEPGWVSGFSNQLAAYQTLPYRITSVVDGIWNPRQLTASVLVLLTVWLTNRLRNHPAQDGSFLGLLALSIGVWWLIVPVIGMLHLVAFPLVVIYLAVYWRMQEQKRYSLMMGTFTSLYVLGVVVFIMGLARPQLDGTHIALAESVYKVMGPSAITLFAIYPLGRRMIFERLGRA